MDNEEEEYYQPTIYDLLGGVLVVSAAWYFDLKSYFEVAVNWLVAVTLGW